MRKWEDIVKDKMEEFDETLPESVFVEFHAMPRSCRRCGTGRSPFTSPSFNT